VGVRLDRSGKYMKFVVSMGIAVTREVYGGVLRAKPAKQPHLYPLSREIPMNQFVFGIFLW
jgi:hypothetical protein